MAVSTWTARIVLLLITEVLIGLTSHYLQQNVYHTTRCNIYRQFHSEYNTWIAIYWSMAEFHLITQKVFLVSSSLVTASFKHIFLASHVWPPVYWPFLLSYLVLQFGNRQKFPCVGHAVLDVFCYHFKVAHRICSSIFENVVRRSLVIRLIEPFGRFTE